MLEHMPKVVGQALRGVGPGVDQLMANKEFAAAPETVTVESDAFTANGPIPAAHTADGLGTSPPISWRGLPSGTAAAVLVIEDADSPTPEPLVHALVLDLPGRDGAVAQGALKGPAGAGEPHALGQNSFLGAEYLPPDPPTGHGPHRYAFQIFALDAAVPLDAGIGRSALVDALWGRVVARGMLIGTYERK